MSFAGVIKTEAESKGITKEKDSVKYRDYCQKLGSSRRAEDPQYWIKIFDKEVQLIEAEEQDRVKSKSKYWEDLIIIDDCRYMNEVGYSMEKGAVLVFVSSGKRKIPEANAKWRNHESEELANNIMNKKKGYGDIFPWVIRNESDESILRNKLTAVYGLWCGIDPDAHYTKCDCELCTSRRQDRPPNIEILLEELLEDMERFENE